MKPRPMPMDVVLRKVRKRLLWLREYHGMRQLDAARAAGLQVAVVTRIETGAQPPSLVQLYALARAYKVDPQSVLP